MQPDYQNDAAYIAIVDEGVALFHANNYVAALPVFLKAWGMHPEAPIATFNVGRTLDELHNPLCEDFYKAAATLGNTDAFYNLALLYVTSGRLQEAVEPLRSYLKAHPEDDGYTWWAQDTLSKICPEPLPLQVVWRNPGNKKFSEKGDQKVVKFGIL